MTWRAEGGRQLIAVVDAAAAARGLRPGLPLADSRAAHPDLVAHAADPGGEARDLDALADWCSRWSPWTATDGTDGLWLDITGVAHLFGGEAALAEAIRGRIADLGFAVRLGLADTPGAAWAVARHAEAGTWGAPGGVCHVPPRRSEAALQPLPVAALRLPASLVAELGRLGLRRVDELMGVARGPLAARFGPALLHQLDRALGRLPEPLSPRRPVPALRVRMAWPEPLGTAAAVTEAVRQLLDGLCHDLAGRDRGARRLTLALYRVDGSVQRAAIGTARPNRDPAHLLRLLEHALGEPAPGFGYEVAVLEAPETEPLPACQTILALPPRQEARPQEARSAPTPAPAANRNESRVRSRIGIRLASAKGLAALCDRLAARLGGRAVHGLARRDSHWPERAQAPCPPPLGDFPASRPATAEAAPPVRPLRLFTPPEPVASVREASETAAGFSPEVAPPPPSQFLWRRHRHRITRAEGPERLAPDWWCAPATATDRDYWRVEDTEGRRLWLYRQAGPAGRGGAETETWYVHGVLA